MTLNKRERYIAIGVGVVIALYVADYFFYEPLHDQLTVAQGQIDQHQNDLQTNQGKLQNSLVARRKWKSLTVNRLATDPSTAEAVLLSRVRDAAQEAGLALGQQNRSQREKQGGFDTVTRRFSGDGTMSQLSQFLFALDQSTIPLRVVDLTISSTKDGTDELSMTLGIATLYEAPEAPAKVAQADSSRGGLQ